MNPLAVTFQPDEPDSSFIDDVSENGISLSPSSSSDLLPSLRSGEAHLRGHKLNPIKMEYAIPTAVTAAIARYGAVGDLFRHYWALNEKDLVDLTALLHRYGWVKLSDACYLAAAVHGLVHSDMLFGHKLQAEESYLDREHYHLPRIIERGSEPGVYYIHLKDHDKRFLGRSKTMIQSNSTTKSSLSLRVFREGADFVEQKYPKRGIRGRHYLDREWSVLNYLTERHVPHLSRPLQFSHVADSEQVGHASLVVDLANVGTASYKMLRKLPLKARWTIFIQCLEALHALHALNVVHGNLKGCNVKIMREFDGVQGKIYRPVITDFRGVGVLFNDTWRPPLMTARSCRPPEFLRGEAALDCEGWKKVDVWMLGLVARAVFAGVKPKGGCQEMMSRALMPGDPARLRWPGSLPAPIQDVLNGMLHADPAQRCTAEAALNGMREAISLLVDE